MAGNGSGPGSTPCPARVRAGEQGEDEVGVLLSAGKKQPAVWAAALEPFSSALSRERWQPVHLMCDPNEATINKANPGSVAGPLLLLLLPVGLLSRLFNNLDKCS